MFFGEEGENALKKLGFTFPSRGASGEPWLGIAVTGHRVIAEALATGRLGQHPPGALDFAVRVPKVCREGELQRLVFFALFIYLSIFPGVDSFV